MRKDAPLEPVGWVETISQGDSETQAKCWCVFGEKHWGRSRRRKSSGMGQSGLWGEADPIICGTDETCGAVCVGRTGEDASAHPSANGLALCTWRRVGAVCVGRTNLGAVAHHSAVCAQTSEVLETTIGWVTDPTKGNGARWCFGGTDLAVDDLGTLSICEAACGTRAHTEESVVDVDARASTRATQRAVLDGRDTDTVRVGEVCTQAE